MRVYSIFIGRGLRSGGFCKPAVPLAACIDCLYAVPRAITTMFVRFVLKRVMQKLLIVEVRVSGVSSKAVDARIYNARVLYIVFTTL